MQLLHFLKSKKSVNDEYVFILSHGKTYYFIDQKLEIMRNFQYEIHVKRVIHYF